MSSRYVITQLLPTLGIVSLFPQSNLSFPYLPLPTPTPLPHPHRSTPPPRLPLEINFTLHYQSESLQTRAHRRNHTNRLHT